MVTTLKTGKLVCGLPPPRVLREMDRDSDDTSSHGSDSSAQSKKGREGLKSSRSQLRRSVSASSMPRVSSAVALWGDAANEFDDEEKADRTLARILAENKKRRAKRQNLVELQGNEWRIEGD